MKSNKKSGREKSTTNSLRDIVESVRHKWELDIHKRKEMNLDDTFMFPQEVSHQTEETIILTDAVECPDKDLNETTLILTKSIDDTTSRADPIDETSETVIQGTGDQAGSDTPDGPHFEVLTKEETNEVIVLSPDSNSRLSLHGKQKEELPETIIQQMPINNQKTKKTFLDFADLDDEEIEETVLLSGKPEAEPVSIEREEETIPETVIQSLSKVESVRTSVDLRSNESDNEQIDETAVVPGGSASWEQINDVEYDPDEIPETILIHSGEESARLPLLVKSASHDRGLNQQTKQSPVSVDSTVRHLAAEIREICTSNPSDLEMVIERHIEKRLHGYSAEQKMLVLDSLSESSDDFQQTASANSEASSERLQELLSLLLGEKLSELDITSPVVLERLAESINTVFDALNQLTHVINFTLLGQQSELETIRYYIGANIEGREATASSLDEYLNQIKQAFLISHQAFCRAAENKVAEILDELNPDRISTLTKKRSRWGPFQKAANFETYTERYRMCEKWFALGKFKRDFLLEFEKNCRTLFMQKGEKSEKNL